MSTTTTRDQSVAECMHMPADHVSIIKKAMIEAAGEAARKLGYGYETGVAMAAQIIQETQ